MRVARYALRRCDAVLCLLHRLATIPEMIESARATGLTLVQVGRRGPGMQCWRCRAACSPASWCRLWCTDL